MRTILRKLFLVKEIKNSEGVIHFLRYRLISTPWFKLYLHKICRSDEDNHMHDHPWNFASLILSGSYLEKYFVAGNWGEEIERVRKPGNMVRHHHTDVHKLSLSTPFVWTLVFASGKVQPWGYQTQFGWIDHVSYRKWKHEGFPIGKILVELNTISKFISGSIQGRKSRAYPITWIKILVTSDHRITIRA